MTIEPSKWKSLDSAPRKDADGKSVPIVLFLPGVFHKIDEKGRPVGDVSHGECVGHYDEALRSWVHSESGNRVFPSLWKAVDA
jgi:hypothetical protein